ncbi:DNA repair protein RecO [Shewanella surugensis]|uniref:DNA repair protein RecO n=1 Tax=Shewanella surugensis TaxID=212020 RepID=A0ABT0L6T7_9GAMM|nr:DNA repair protein RecO [Shewanella surugensis]MCL1123100.1 DNA repair protein RecO [Shewanella surugensis]
MLRGYVLHTRPYRDNRVIVNLLVDGQGRVDAIARLGGRKNSIRSILQPFQPLLFALSGHGALKNVTQIEAASPAVPLLGNSLYAGLYLNELLIRCLTVEHQAEHLFFNYHQTLLSIAVMLKEQDLRYFELALLQELGTMPSLVLDPLDMPITGEGFYRLLPDKGFMPVYPTSFTAHQFFKGSMLSALANQTLTGDDLFTAKKLMRQLLGSILGNKPLYSRALFKQRQSIAPL